MILKQKISDQIEVQLQDLTGNWRTFAITMNDSQLINAQMKELKDRYPDMRVRAIDSSGRVVDLMP